MTQPSSGKLLAVDRYQHRDSQLDNVQTVRGCKWEVFIKILPYIGIYVEEDTSRLWVTSGHRFQENSVFQIQWTATQMHSRRSVFLHWQMSLLLFLPVMGSITDHTFWSYSFNTHLCLQSKWVLHFPPLIPVLHLSVMSSILCQFEFVPVNFE